MIRNRKILLGLATAAALAASAIAGAAPGAAGPGSGPCPHAGEGPGMMGMGMGSGPGAGRGGPGMMGMEMGSGPGTGRGGPGMMGSGPGGGAGYSPAAAIEGRFAALKTALNITANQESAWQVFATKAKQQVESMHAPRARAAAPAQTAPERLAQRAEFAKQRAAEVEAMSVAVKDLYDALTPEQKAIADQRLAFGGMGAMGGHGFRR